MNQKGFAPIIFILIVFLVSGSIIGTSLYIRYKQPQLLNKIQNKPSPVLQVITTPQSSEDMNGFKAVYKNISFQLPTKKIDSQQARESSIQIKYNQDKVITILSASPSALLRVGDLSLDNNSFIERYKKTTGVEVSLQKQAIEKYSGNYDRSIATEITTQDKLKLIKKLFANFEGHQYSVVEHNGRTFILDKSVSFLSIALEDKSGNYYQILVKDNENTLNNVVSTLQVN